MVNQRVGFLSESELYENIMLLLAEEKISILTQAFSNFCNHRLF